MEENKTQVVEATADPSEIQPIAETEAAAEVVATKNDFEIALKAMLSNKANRVFKGLVVRNVIKKDDDEDYTRITLVVNGNIPGYLPTDDGYKRGVTSNVYTTTYAIAAVLKQSEDTAMLGNYVVEHPEVVPALLSGATINLIQSNVAKGEEYRNPFTTKENPEPYVSDHDWIVNNIYGLKLGKIGLKMVDKMLDKLVELAIG